MEKNLVFFAIISRAMWNFGDLSAPVYRDRGLYRSAAKSSGISLKLMPEGAKLFHGGPYEGPLKIYH